MKNQETITITSNHNPFKIKISNDFKTIIDGKILIYKDGIRIVKNTL